VTDVRWGAIGAALGLLIASPATAAKGDAPLFAEDTALAVTITGPVDSISRNAERSTEPQQATLAANGETLPITLAARGITRRRNCDFPPMMVDFVDKPGDASLFHKQNRLKLVTHCKGEADFDRYVLREYAAYKLYNVLTPESLKVRLAKIRYVDDGKPVTERWGFFIEDIDDLGKRVGGKELEVTSVLSPTLDPSDAARYVLFQYMIGNLDWDMTNGPPGSECCHNSKLIGKTAEAREALTPVPYDFDFSGFVNAPYATPPDAVPVQSVRTRYFRGLCRHSDAVRAEVAAFQAARPAFDGVLQSIDQFTPRDRDNMRKYLAAFYDDIATAKGIDKVLKTCRKAQTS
jgi:hypothetical protein